MSIFINEREYRKIAELLAAKGLLCKAAPGLSILKILGDSQVTLGHLPPPTGQPPPKPPIGSIGLIQNTLSDFVQSLTKQIDNVTTEISKSTYTSNFEAGIRFEVGGVSFSASGGVVASFNFHTTNYVLPNLYLTTVPAPSTASLPSIGFHVGGNIGLGEISAFEGRSTSVSGSIFNISYNSNFKSAGLQFGATLLGVPGATYSEQSETKLYGPMQSGNVLSDIESVENTLWNMAQDPISGTFR